MPANNPTKRTSLVGKILFWLPVLLCMGFIYFSSSIPGKDISPLFPFQDVLFHITIYMILAYLFMRALKNTFLDIITMRAIMITVLFGSIYGLGDEFHQLFVPGRYVSGLDLFLDTIGSIMGSILHCNKNKDCIDYSDF